MSPVSKNTSGHKKEEDETQLYFGDTDQVEEPEPPKDEISQPDGDAPAELRSAIWCRRPWKNWDDAPEGQLLVIGYLLIV